MFDDNFSLLKVTNLTLWTTSQFLVATTCWKCPWAPSTRIMHQCNIIKHCLHVWKYVDIKRSAPELRPMLGRCCQWTRHDDSNFIPFPSCLFFRGYKYSISCPWCSENHRGEFNNFYHSLFSTHQHKRCVCWTLQSNIKLWAFKT